MFDKELKELELISTAVGKRQDYVQGGGGNTSVKLNDELMAVKASGFKLNQITPTEGYVVINYKNIKNYYENVDLSIDKDYEKESVDFAKSNVVDMEGLKKLRPSVEAGFHSILKKYVIHTHPVYANIVCCSKNGKEIAERLLNNQEFAYLWIPYINPGFCLTLKIMDGIKECMEKQNKFPEVIFMENHGIIVTSDDYTKAIALHDQVNELIKEQLGISEAYPQIKLDTVGESTVKSSTVFISEFVKNKKIEKKYFEDISLYPDQLVYLNGNIAADGVPNKLSINSDTGEIIYNTNFTEAMSIEETLLGYLYVVNGIEKSGLPIKVMTDREKDFINNWESEAYRKSLLKEVAK